MHFTISDFVDDEAKGQGERIPTLSEILLRARQVIQSAQNNTLHIPNTEDITPKHGFASNLFGRRTRSFGRGGRGRAAMVLVAVVCAGFGTMMGDEEMRAKDELGVMDS